MTNEQSEVVPSHQQKTATDEMVDHSQRRSIINNQIDKWPALMSF